MKLRNKILTVALALNMLAIPLAEANNSSYLCQEVYDQHKEKYEKHKVTRHLGEGLLGATGATAAGVASGMALGAEAYYILLCFGIGLIPPILAASIGVGVYSIFNRYKRVKPSMDIFEFSKMSESEVDEIDLGKRLEYEVQQINYYRRGYGLAELSEEEIEQVKQKLSKTKRMPNIFDQFVHSVNKSGRNTNFSYEEVRAGFIKLATETKKFCPKILGKRRPLSYRKLVKETKTFLKL